MGLLNKAKAKAADTKTAPKKKQTLWQTNDHQDVAEAISKLVALQSELKSITARQEPLKDLIKRHADNTFIAAYVAEGDMPDTPMILQNSSGHRVTFVVQDRSSNTKVTDEQAEQLAMLFGEDAVEDLVYEEHSFTLNRDVLAAPGVSEIVEAALENAIAEIVEQGLLSQESAEALVTAEAKRSFRPGILNRIYARTKRDVAAFRNALGVIGSSCVRYVKV